MAGAELKVALVGCGQIADSHLQELRHVTRAKAVAVCDRQFDLARQAAARFGVPAAFDDLDRLLDEVRPDVVHVTTPPQSHRDLALQAIAGGAHVYVEKPFALDTAEAEAILAAAEAAGRFVCVGHDQLFDPVWVDCRRLLRSGALGRVVHVDSYQGYDLSGPFGRAFAADPDHWVRRLPGGLFQNVMSHALYRITDVAGDGPPDVRAHWSGDAAGGGLPTELRVTLSWRESTGNLVFSSAARPIRRVARIYGTRGGVEADLDARVLRRERAPATPGAFAKLELPLRDAREASKNAASNLGRFLRNRLHYFAGMRALFEAFHRTILDGEGLPIPYEAIRRDTAIMDEIFARCRAGRAGDDGINTGHAGGLRVTGGGIR